MSRIKEREIMQINKEKPIDQLLLSTVGLNGVLEEIIAEEIQWTNKTHTSIVTSLKDGD